MEVSLVDTNPVLRKSETDLYVDRHYNIVCVRVKWEKAYQIHPTLLFYLPSFQDIILCTLFFESGMPQTPRIVTVFNLDLTQHHIHTPKGLKE